MCARTTKSSPLPKRRPSRVTPSLVSNATSMPSGGTSAAVGVVIATEVVAVACVVEPLRVSVVAVVRPVAVVDELVPPHAAGMMMNRVMVG